MKLDDIPTSFRSRAEILADLRRRLPEMGGMSSRRRCFPFGLAEIDARLRGGLAAEALHEFAPEETQDMPAAFGFLVAFLGLLPAEGPLLWIAPPRGLGGCDPYGHGLNGFGLDPGRVILVEAACDEEALWAMEEALRSTVPAAVAGVIAGGLDLKASRRLHLAAESAGLPLLLMRQAQAEGTSAAATRWRIGAAHAFRDRFGLFGRPGWRLRLERCRNGHPAEFLVEWDHAAYRFRLAAAVADRALSEGLAPAFGLGRP